MENGIKDRPPEGYVLTLTSEERIELCACLSIVSDLFKGSIAKWESLAAKTGEDGKARFKHAASNAEALRRRNSVLEQIRKKVDS